MIGNTIVGITLTIAIYQTVRTAKDREWGWFYFFLALSVSGGLVIGMNLEELRHL
jgi:hypothetical protein